jgi:hypothetical protein
MCSVLFSGIAMEGEEDFGGEAAGGARVEREVAAERFGEFAGDRQAEAGAGGLGGVEGLKQAAAGLFGEAGAVVEDAENGAFGGGCDFEIDVAGGLGADGVDGIAKEIEEELFEELGVGIEGEGMDGGFEMEGGRIDEVLGVLAEGGFDVGGVDGLEVGEGGAAVEEEVLDEIFEAGCFGEDGGNEGGVGTV